MKNDEQKISIIIKTSNSGETLINTLEAISTLGEIIAIDEHSTDDTADILNEYKVKIIFTDKFDCVAAYNQAIEEAKGDWILMLEDDEIVQDDLLSELENYAKNPKKNKFALSFDIKTFYLNKEIKCAKRKNVLKFFKKGYCEFKNANLKIKVGKVNKIKGKCILKYVSGDIAKFLNNVVDKNRIKLKNTDKIVPSPVLKPVFEFIKYYIFKLGFIDGYRGFIYAKERYIEKFALEVMFLEKNFKENK